MRKILAQLGPLTFTYFHTEILEGAILNIWLL